MLYRLVTAPKSDDEFRARREAFCEHIGLNAEQRAILLDVADRYKSYMDGLKSTAERRVGPASLAVNGTLTER